MTKAIEDVIAERKRQIEHEGWSHYDDDRHERGELAADDPPSIWIETPPQTGDDDE